MRLDSVSGNNHINTSSGSTTTAHTYDGAGNIVRSQTSINAFGNTTTMQHTETIDDAGRPISEYIKINGGADKMIGQSVYNYKDQLVTRYQGNTGLGGSVEWLQKTDYTYRLDGLLSKINDNNLTGGVQPITWCSLPQEHTPSSGSSYDERDLFCSILHYDEEVSGSSAPEQYNGNLAHVEWQVKGRRKQMYAYTYDEYNRPTEAEYYDRNTANKGWDQSGIYDSEYTYDERGNILTLKRKGRMSGDSCFVTGDIDNLSYTYASNTNQLSTVTESASMTWGFKNPTSNTTPYEYDDNGSMTEDHYKGVVTVYNHLTLPVVISKGTDSILLTYDAGGTLLRKQHKSGSTVVMTRDYIGGIEYFNDTLDAIYHSEGRIKYIDEVGRYEYYIRDHLGNIRLTYSDLNADGLITTPDEILEEMHYYAFGMMMEGSWMGDAGQYGYNGIEYENFLDLEMNLATYRGLDPALGRWWQVDPKGEALYGLSPYNSMGNNPVRNIDPNGDLFFAIPQISFNGGFSIGLEIGIGKPGVLSASISGGIGTNGGYWSIQGNAVGLYVGYGSSGAFAGYGYQLKNGFSAGYDFGSGTASLGFGGSFGNNNSASVGISYGNGGFGFNSSLSRAFMWGEKPLDYSTEVAKKVFKEDYSELPPDHTSLIADNSLPDDPNFIKDKYFDTEGNLRGRDGSYITGFTHELENGNSIIYLYKFAFRNRKALSITIGHEYYHARLFKAGIRGAKRHHAAIAIWENAKRVSLGLPELHETRSQFNKLFHEGYFHFSDLYYAPKIKN